MSRCLSTALTFRPHSGTCQIAAESIYSLDLFGMRLNSDPRRGWQSIRGSQEGGKNYCGTLQGIWFTFCFIEPFPGSSWLMNRDLMWAMKVHLSNLYLIMGYDWELGETLHFFCFTCVSLNECRLRKNSKRLWNQAMRKSWKKPWTRQSRTKSAKRPGKTIARQAVLHAAIRVNDWMNIGWK